MLNSKSLSNNKVSSGWQVAAVAGILLALGIHIAFVFLGRVNADEGWYLYTSQLVYGGQRPYQDFAFTQTPVLPYIYGLPQLLFSGSLYAGRVTSVVLSMSAMVLSLGVARRYEGDKGSAITALLWSTFSFGIYFQTITKTYALTTFFLTLSIFILTSETDGQRKYILATIIVLLATLTRLSAILFAIPIILYCFVRSENRTRYIVGGIVLLALGWIAFLSLPNIEAAIWNLVGYHAGQWGDLSLSERFVVIFRDRSRALFRVFPSYFLIVIILGLTGFKKIWGWFDNNRLILLITGGLLLLNVPHLISGGFHAEYFVPFVFVLLPVISILFVVVDRDAGLIAKVGLYGVLIIAMGAALFRGGPAFVDRTGGQLPVEEIKEVASFVESHSEPDDRIFALEGLWAVLEADRQTVPNMTLAQFSFIRDSTERATSLKLINEEITLNYFTNTLPKIIILTENDWRKINNSQNPDALITALEEGYELGLEKSEWGQFHVDVQVYIRR